MAATRKLDPVEIRVLGTLMEKEQATPDAYPMTVNALRAAANQKTNREPVTSLAEEEVWDALDRLRQEVLVWRSEGARTERWEHRLDRRWHLDGAAKAVVTLLLLRGPQTPGELRTRSDRLHRFASVEEVAAVLRRLSREPEPLVVELARRPGQKESRWAHTVGVEGPEAAGEPTGEPIDPIDPIDPIEWVPASPRAVPAAAASPGGEWQERLARLEARLEELAAELHGLRRRLGDAPATEEEE